MAVDHAAGADVAHAPAQPAKWRLGGALWLLGMPGVVAVVWALLPTLKANEALAISMRPTAWNTEGKNCPSAMPTTMHNNTHTVR